MRKIITTALVAISLATPASAQMIFNPGGKTPGTSYLMSLYFAEQFCGLSLPKHDIKAAVAAAMIEQNITTGDDLVNFIRLSTTMAAVAAVEEGVFSDVCSALKTKLGIR